MTAPSPAPDELRRAIDQISNFMTCEEIRAHYEGEGDRDFYINRHDKMIRLARDAKALL